MHLSTKIKSKLIRDQFTKLAYTTCCLENVHGYECSMGTCHQKCTGYLTFWWTFAQPSRFLHSAALRNWAKLLDFEGFWALCN